MRLHRLAAVAGIVLALVAWRALADGTARAAPELVFASIEEGRAALTRRDEFIERLSAFDRAARIHRAGATTEEFLEVVGRSVRDWPAEERAAVAAAYATLRPQLDALKLPWPSRVLVVHTSGEEEGGATYTRGDAIVLAPAQLAAAERPALARTLAHELFHVLSRANPALRDRAYAAIGFLPCGEIPLPSSLRDLRITNPDAPRNDHCIEVGVDGAHARALPILYARTPYDARRSAPFFAYMELRLLVLDPAGRYDDAHPRLIAIEGVQDFFEQAGRNTQYVIHPEEILADNFALIVMRPASVPSPEVLARIERALRDPGAVAPAR
jgi:hypothetical protein